VRRLKDAASSKHKALKASQETYVMPRTTQASRAAIVRPSVVEELRGFQGQQMEPLSSQNSQNLRRVSQVAKAQMVEVPVTQQGSWYVPTSLKEILDLLAQYPGARIVAGNAASSWVRLFNQPADTKFISIKHVAEFTGEPTF
jgi:xanthine dehydrogenase iron-sulfur cluster and FAD-binding subunit A